MRSSLYNQSDCLHSGVNSTLCTADLFASAVSLIENKILQQNANLMSDSHACASIFYTMGLMCQGGLDSIFLSIINCGFLKCKNLSLTKKRSTIIMLLSY